jgi:hypothetical protein
MFDHFQPDAVLGRCLSGMLTGVALIDIGQFDVFPGDLLHRLG